MLLTLYAWQQLLPGSVFLNRGNHEERSVNMLNGFEKECMQKYGDDMHERFVSTFAWLPLGTIVNGKVFVVHGGVDDNLTLADLEAAPRSEYQISDGQRNTKRLMHPAMMAQQLAVQAEREIRIKPIASVLWNDPIEDEGTRPNDVRSIGLFFGPDVASRFLHRSDLGLIVRSHEQVESGVQWPFGAGRSLVTVFSASNYSGKMQNQGAYALLGSASDASDATAASTCVDAREELHDGSFGYPFGRLRFMQYETRQLSETRAQQRTAHRLRALVLAHRAKLEHAYQVAEDRGSTANGGVSKGVLPVQQWAEVTQQVLGMHNGPSQLQLLPLRELLLGAEAAAASSPGVDYRKYLARHQLVNPRLEPLFRIHEFLLVLMYRAAYEGTRAGEGMLPMRMVERICQVMASHFGAQATLYLHTYTLRPHTHSHLEQARRRRSVPTRPR